MAATCINLPYQRPMKVEKKKSIIRSMMLGSPSMGIPWKFEIDPRMT
jgi:hypothetical protein